MEVIRKKNFTFCHPVSHWKKRRIRVLRGSSVLRICGSGSIPKHYGSGSLGLIIFLYLQEERMFPSDTSSWTRRRGRSSTLMATEPDGSGRSWSYNPSAITSLRHLLLWPWMPFWYQSFSELWRHLPIWHYNVTINSSQSILTASIILTFNATLRFSFVPTNQLKPNTRWFREGLVLQSVSHNVIFRVGHEMLL